MIFLPKSEIPNYQRGEFDKISYIIKENRQEI